MAYTALKTFEDACTIEGLDPEKVLPDFSVYPERDRKAMTAMSKLIIINRAANRLANGGNEWQPNWNDSNQYKYFPWFYMGGSSGFRFDGCDVWASISYVGSRLCFVSYDVCEYVANQFIDLYRDFMVNPVKS